MAVSLAEGGWLFLLVTIILFLKSALLQQFLFPLMFQVSGHQAVLRLHGVILPGGAVRLILGAFQSMPPLLVRNGPASKIITLPTCMW